MMPIIHVSRAFPILFFLAMLSVFFNSPDVASALTEVEVNPVNTPQGAVVLIVDGLSAPFIYPELTPYALDGTPLEKAELENLPEISKESKVIITTAYQEYAIKGYELNVTDYLLKPFTFDRFLKAVSKAQESMSQSALSSPPENIFVKTENRLEKINLSEIIYIEGMRDYRRIHTADKRIMTLQNFSELEKVIPSNIVCRVHKSFMVGINKIESIERSRIKIFNQIIPISETYRELFFQIINKSNI